MRLYVVGDIHGRLDCLNDLIGQIERDRAGFADTVEYIFLGDLVDRGPDSKGVVQRLLDLSRQDPTPMRFLVGNHEEVMLMALSGDRSAMTMFNRIGGRETAESYGADLAAYDILPPEECVETLRWLVPDDHFNFLSEFQDRIAIGDYRFVHAGVRPGISFENQSKSDLRWIRRRFLEHDQPFDGMVVHGHTVTPDVEVRSNRIGIDTGAYRSGRLTCLVLEGESQRFLQTELAPNPVFATEDID